MSSNQPSRTAKQQALQVIRRCAEEEEPSDNESCLTVFSDAEDLAENLEDDSFNYQTEDSISNLSEEILANEDEDNNESDETYDRECDEDDEIVTNKLEGLISPSGMIWRRLEEGARSGRQPQCNVFKGNPGVRPGIHPKIRIRGVFDVF
jgi:hypothetical protein